MNMQLQDYWLRFFICRKFGVRIVIHFSTKMEFWFANPSIIWSTWMTIVGKMLDLFILPENMWTSPKKEKFVCLTAPIAKLFQFYGTKCLNPFFFLLSTLIFFSPNSFASFDPDPDPVSSTDLLVLFVAMNTSKNFSVKNLNNIHQRMMKLNHYYEVYCLRIMMA